MAGNANSGRRPQPTALKVLRGNPGGRRLPTNEPAPPVADVSFDEPPPELADDALAGAEWRRVAPMLRVCGLVSESDRSALAALCQQWSRYLDAQRRVRELGMVVKKPNGMPITNPYLAIADRALAHCKGLWTMLGLTPSGRSRMTALPAAETANKSKWVGLL